MSILKLYNTEQQKTDLISVHKAKAGCCGESEFCKSRFQGAVTNVTEVTLETEEGPTQVVFDNPANSPREVRKAIAKALLDAGYDPYYDDAWRGIVVNADSICLTGEVPISAITIDGTAETLEKSCETGRICKLRGMVNYDTDAGLMVFDGSTGTQVGTPAGFVAGNEAAVKAAIEAAITAEGVAFTSVEVKEHPEHEAYVYTIHTVDEVSISVGGSMLAPCGCYPDFIFA